MAVAADNLIESLGQENSPLFALTCPHCGTRLKVKSSDVGTRRSCPKCSRAITVGAAEKPVTDSMPSSRPQDEFPVDCSCGTRFYATPSQIGQTADCPDCLTEHKIVAPRVHPSQKKYPSPSPISVAVNTSQPAVEENDDEYRLQPLDESPVWQPPAAPKSPPPRSFHVRCQVCNASLAANESLVGRNLSCPDCGSSVPVVKPTFVAKKTVVVAKDPKIGVENAHQLKRQKEISDRLMADAHAHEEEIEKHRHAAPKAPFTEGVYGYPLQPRVLQGWGLLVPLLGAALDQLGAGFASAAHGRLGAVFNFIIAGGFLIPLTIGMGHVMMTFLQTTATGYPQPEEWEPFDAGAWLGRTLYFLCALFYAAIPMIFVTSFLAGFLPSFLRAIMVGTFAFFTFPFVLMSMLDADSPAVPFSGYVWKTIGQALGSWFKFYLGATCVFAFSTIPIVAASYFLGRLGTFFAAAFVLASLALYFRLLGRLAWVLDQLPVESELDGVEVDPDGHEPA